MARGGGGCLGKVALGSRPLFCSVQGLGYPFEARFCHFSAREWAFWTSSRGSGHRSQVTGHPKTLQSKQLGPNTKLVRGCTLYGRGRTRYLTSRHPLCPQVLVMGTLQSLLGVDVGLAGNDQTRMSEAWPLLWPILQPFTDLKASRAPSPSLSLPLAMPCSRPAPAHGPQGPTPLGLLCWNRGDGVRRFSFGWRRTSPKGQGAFFFCLGDVP